MRKGEKQKKKEDEVEDLLQAAQDEVLLNLSLNSHIARASPNNDLDVDLERRFQALKSSRHSSAPPSDSDSDLSARFAALKAKSSSANAKEELPLPPTASRREHEDEEDQIQKLIQWAKDAARLDPSPPSDDEQTQYPSKRI